MFMKQKKISVKFTRGVAWSWESVWLSLISLRGVTPLTARLVYNFRIDPAC